MKAPAPAFVAVICVSLAFVNLVTAPMSTSRPGVAYLVGYVGTPIVIAALYAGWYVVRHRKVH